MWSGVIERSRGEWVCMEEEAGVALLHLLLHKKVAMYSIENLISIGYSIVFYKVLPSVRRTILYV